MSSIQTKREQLAHLLQQQLKRHKTKPLSYAQQRLWFLDQLEPGNTIYIIPFAVRMHGLLDKEGLRWSFMEIVRRHEVLRTTFRIEAGQPVQVISAEPKMEIEQIDLRDLGTEEREAETNKRVGAEWQEGFDLECGPLLRVKLLQLNEQEHVLLVTMHHIVSDGWSVEIMVREFSQLYEAYVKGEESPLEELKIQYGDFAVWQREWLQGEVLEERLGYWRKQLEGVEALGLITDGDNIHGGASRYSSGQIKVKLERELTDRLKELSRREGVTLFMTVLAVWQVLLGKYTGQSDVAVGTPVANRNRVETEGLIGFFVNTLVLRSRWRWEESFREVLARVRTVALEAYGHQDMPFERVVEELQPERDRQRTPLFQVMFTLQTGAEEELKMKGIRLEEVKVEEGGRAKFELSLNMREKDEAWTGALEYARELYGRRRMERMVEHWVRLLEEVARDGGQRIGEIGMVSEAERKQVMEEWNRTEMEYERKKCVHELIEEQAERCGEAVAVVYEGEYLSYGELNRRANQLGHYLRRQGVGPEVHVGICMERSPEMLIALLGVLKAGGAYVPLDPEYPQPRLRRILEDADADIVLTCGRLREFLPGEGVIAMDGNWDKIREEHDTDLERTSELSSTAYVIYTSGSTGKPKGVMVSHQNVMNHMAWMLNEFPMEEDERLLQKTTFTFDASFWEFFGPLMRGGQAVMLASGKQSAENLLFTIQQNGVTRLQFIPSALKVLLSQDGFSTCTASLKTVFCGGEALTAEIPAKFFERSRAELHNIYGPTETTIISTFHRIRRQEILTSNVPIGRPIANTQLYVLDSTGQPLPVDVAGELYIGGEGVVRGYLKQPELTAERFVPDPFSKHEGERLYRTGDRVRWRSDGTIEFLGRLDDQVKVRGYRIELGEIEAALLEQEGVTQAVVVVREAEGRGKTRKRAGEKRLVAYVVMNRAVQVEEEQWRRGLRRRLPEYMVPAVIMKLEELPLSANGKLNRKALPEPEWGEGEKRRRSWEEGEASIEGIVRGIWEEVLKVEGIGRVENFFELGGHSLLATQVISRIRQVFGVEVPLPVIFEEGTVRSLAERISEEREKKERAEAEGREKREAPPLVRVENRDRLPLSYAQQRLWFLDQLEPGNTSYNIGYALKLVGGLDKKAMRRSVDEIVRRHEMLRTRFREQDGVAVQELVEPGTEWFQIEEIDLRELEESERNRAAKEQERVEMESPFDLDRGPLLRVKLVELSEKEHVLLATMHHIVSDGWSMGILVREFSRLYEAYRKGEESPLEELKIQYGDYAVWQRGWLQGEVLEEQLRYWREQLAGMEALELPSDCSRPVMPSNRGDFVVSEISAEVTAQLRGLCRREGVTLFMVLLGGLQVLLARYAGGHDIVVGTPVANRTRREIEDLIGFFVNTLVLRAQVKRERSFRELLKQAREVTLAAFTNQAVPFEKVVEELQPVRDTSRSPLFQVMLSLQNAPQEELSMPDLQVHVWESGIKESAKFDLTFMAVEKDKSLEIGIHYAQDLFQEATIQRLSRHLCQVLTSVAANAACRIEEITLLDAAERRQVLEHWNQTQRQYSRSETIVALIERQAERTPNATAVVHGERKLSYRELNQQANQVAHYLRSLGVSPEMPVALCMERGLETLVALLGVLKAGGLYVPLDSTLAPEQLALMLKDTDALLLLTETNLEPRLPYYSGTIVRLDKTWNHIHHFSTDNIQNRVNGENLAYVIHTSGSTGRAKGVAIRHSALLNLVAWHIDTYKLTGGDRATQFASLSFDAAVWEIWPTLATGASLWIVDDRLRVTPSALAEWLCTSAITVAFLPTPVAEAVLRENWPGSHSLRYLLTGGDKLHSQSWQSGTFILVNHYGPTETTVVTTAAIIERDLFTRQAPPIGKPIANVSVYIVDEELRPVPVGVAGELYIGGEGLARGYLNRPDLTAERFVPNPFVNHTMNGQRLYRTGDRVRWLADGNLEFMDRLDQQVKIRGFRIELGEIESALQEHPAIRQATVTVWEDLPGNKWLVAYVVPAAGTTELQNSHLREHLKSFLPEYKIPHLYVRMERLSLNSSGKVDRRALPVPDVQLSTGNIDFVGPRTPVEEALADIWKEILGRQRISIHDNFFDLGGHSLSITRLASRIRSRFQIDVPLRALFDAPTLIEMTVAIASAQTGLEDAQEVLHEMNELKQLSAEEIDALLQQEISPNRKFTSASKA